MENLLIDKKINEFTTCLIREADKEGKTWKVLVIQSGLSKNGNYYSPEVLQQAIEKFEGVKVFAYEFAGKYFEHLPTNFESEKGYIKNLVGDLNNCRYEEFDNGVSGITADLKVYNEFYKTLFKNMWQEGKMDIVGFSAVMEAEVEPKYTERGQVNFVKNIYEVKSVDVVSSPAAGGRIINILESKRRIIMNKEKIIENIRVLAPELLEGKDVNTLDESELIDLLAEAVEKNVNKEKAKNKEKEEPKIEEEKKVEGTPEELLILNKIKELLKDKNVDEAIKMIDDFIKVKSKTSYGYGYPAPSESINPEITNTLEELKQFKTMYYLEKYLNESNLPEPAKDKIRKMFSGKYATEEEIKKAIEMEKESLSKIVESLGVNYGFGGQEKAKVILDEFDRKQRALELTIGYRPDDSDKHLYVGIKPYSGIREAYEDITKDYGVTGNPKHFAKLMESFPAGFVYANFPTILGDALNKRLAKEYPMVSLEQWRKFVNVVQTKDFNTQRVIRWGALGSLEDVTEGSDYNEYTIGSSSLEEVATYDPKTKGVVISITRKMILSDNLGYIQKIPKMLARAASRTLNRFVYDLLINYGGSPTPSINGGVIYDNLALYHSNHRNLLTSALTYDALLQAKDKMTSQYIETLDNSSEIDYIGITPKFLIVPPTLENTAIALVESQNIPDSADNTINVLYKKFEIIVSPFLRDDENWYLVADPNETDTIEIGFVQGKETPELIVQDIPTAGFVFTADKISYKVRYEFGGAVVDYRAFVGSLVI